MSNTKSRRPGCDKHSRQKNKKNQDFQNIKLSRKSWSQEIGSKKSDKKNGASSKLLALFLSKKIHRLEFGIDFGSSQFRSCEFIFIIIYISCSLDPTTNPKPMNPKCFTNFYNFYFFNKFFLQKQSERSENSEFVVSELVVGSGEQLSSFEDWY